MKVKEIKYRNIKLVKQFLKNYEDEEIIDLGWSEEEEEFDDIDNLNRQTTFRTGATYTETKLNAEQLDQY